MDFVIYHSRFGSFFTVASKLRELGKSNGQEISLLNLKFVLGCIVLLVLWLIGADALGSLWDIVTAYFRR